MGLGDAPPQGTIALIVLTAVISTLVGVFGKRAAETLMNLFLRPFKWASERIYRWFAPRNPFSLSLRSYKRHVKRSWLTKIENPIGPELDVPLAHAFAPLKLISSSSQESIDLFTHIATSKRCIVLGGPGTGKTTLMKSLITSVVNGQANEQLNSLIPVFVVLRKLAVRQHSVKEAIVAAFSEFHFPGADKFIDSALRQGRMLIVLDGLDEVGVNRQYVAGQIISFCENDDQRPQKNRVIVTCREYSYRSDDLGSVIRNIVRVEPFANHHMRVFLQGWPPYQGRSALRLFGLIQGDSQIRDICRNPLLLTILTGLYLETSDFEFPSSRNLFYKAAIEELITKRQARRETKQNFEGAEKWQVLQRVSLKRLETVRIDEDPEELTSDSIREQVAAVFRRQIDFNEFIKELVEVNGIIKPSSEEVYTCAHRTIQEYFAANEAGRIRTSKEVVERFSTRQDLIEVLYFYCGMLNNIPQLTRIIQSFVQDGRWLDAGRCLLNMPEVPDGLYVETVTAELSKHISSSSEFKPALEVLSSLAQRPQMEFEFARNRFFEAVNRLAGGTEAASASALESALATSPDAAMKVIPGLLRHESKRLQAAAIQLLKDIGTDASLDQLVQLLAHDNDFIRAEAGKTLAGIIKSRNQDLKDRAALLPDREDRVVWPLDRFFPSKLAIPIAESTINLPATGNKAIDCAARVIRIRRGLNDRDEHRFLRAWRNLARDVKLSGIRLSAARFVAWGVLMIPTFLMIVLTIAQMWCYRTDVIAFLDIKTLNVKLIENRMVRDTGVAAQEIVSDIENRYPPNASGLSRILPWNWSVEPIIPENCIETFETLKGIRGRSFLYGADTEHINLDVISRLVPQSKVEAFVHAEASLNDSLSSLPERYVMIRPDAFNVTFVFIAPVIFVVMRKLQRRMMHRSRTFYRSTAMTFLLGNLPLLMIAILGVELLLLFPGRGLSPIKLCSLGIIISAIVLGLSIPKFQWPRNPLLEVVDEVLPTKIDARGDLSISAK
jgi:NACHT domain